MPTHWTQLVFTLCVWEIKYDYVFYNDLNNKCPISGDKPRSNFFCSSWQDVLTWPCITISAIRTDSQHRERSSSLTLTEGRYVHLTFSYLSKLVREVSSSQSETGVMSFGALLNVLVLTRCRMYIPARRRHLMLMTLTYDYSLVCCQRVYTTSWLWPWPLVLWPCDPFIYVYQVWSDGPGWGVIQIVKRYRGDGKRNKTTMRYIIPEEVGREAEETARRW